MSKTQRNQDFEPVDNTPVEIPTRLRLPQSRTDQMRRFIREEMSRHVADQGHETFAEADDIEPDDEENMPMSPYELMELEPPAPLQTDVKAEGQPPVDPAAKPEGKPPAKPEAPANGT